MGFIKEALRETLILFHIDLTQNLKYDRLTRKILKTQIKSNANCIDIGCHKGEILDMMLQFSPTGKHYGFEPIPQLFQHLEEKYKNRATIYPYALSDSDGESSFQMVTNALAYSGLKKRHYDIERPDIKEIKVQVRRLDQLIPKEEKIDLIKIDVEGGEFGVLKGAQSLLVKDKPIIIFECGKGASDYYGTKPGEIFDLLTAGIGLHIYTLEAFLNKKPALEKSVFEDYFNTNKEYYFVAGPR